MAITRRKWLIAGGLALLLAALAAASLLFRRERAIEVEVETIRRQRLEAIVTASGQIQPKRLVNISADTMGRVTQLAVNEGDRVRVGQFLLQIDPRNLRTRVESGEAGLRAVQAQLEQAEVGLEGARTALRLAEETLKRQRELWSQGLTTREALDRADAEARQRAADVQEREKQIEVLRRRVEQERAALAGARYDLSKVRITSPIDGIVTRRNIEEGETVVVGTMNNPGTVLLTIADMSVIEAEVEVDETDIPSVRIGQPAVVTIDALRDRKFKGRVTEVGNSPIQVSQGAGAGQQATNFKVVVTLDDRIEDVRPGFTCSAAITTATREQAVAVPIQALAVREVVYDRSGRIVRQRNDRRSRSSSALPTASAQELPPGHTRREEEGVFVVRGTTAEFVPVKTGIAGDRYFEVLSGLQPGDRVITGPFNSVRTLRDGDTIKPKPADARGRR
ncbi:MAG TPA: efflux RND transporter periplasmic adaptor subunit [Vicinamibacterales bacterium]|nr:efflux RND transporter periplasmic adaptor subunit [Vicinamibacterales bacterium]